MDYKIVLRVKSFRSCLCLMVNYRNELSTSTYTGTETCIFQKWVSRCRIGFPHDQNLQLKNIDVNK